MSAPFIRINDLYKIFKMGHVEVKALAGVNLEVEENAFCLVMGPSGSGKSTLLYMIGGLDRPTSGEISVNGKAVDRLDENQLAVFRRRTVGFVFQSFNLISSMTALENVAFPLRFAGIARRQRQSLAMDLLDRVGLADRAHHRPTELSGGEQQRVAIARALVHEPHIILADEPTGNLDTTSGESVMEQLVRLHRDGVTVVMVTHDNRLVNYATRVVQILDGRILNSTPASHQ